MRKCFAISRVVDRLGSLGDCRDMVVCSRLRIASNMVRYSCCRAPGCNGTYMGNNACSEPPCQANQRGRKRSTSEDERRQRKRARARTARADAQQYQTDTFNAPAARFHALGIPAPPLPPSMAASNSPFAAAAFMELRNLPPRPFIVPPRLNQSVPPATPPPAEANGGPAFESGGTAASTEEAMSIAEVRVAMQGFATDGAAVLNDIQALERTIQSFLDELVNVLSRWPHGRT